MLTGGPSTGKTTLLNALAGLGYATVPEAAREVIDEALANGISAATLRADEKQFQEEVMRRKIDVERILDKNVITFFDRGMQDTIAYLEANDLAVEPWVSEQMNYSTYRKVFLLMPVGEFQKDYARTEDAAFTERIHGLLEDAYSKQGIEVVVVPPLEIEERVDFILQHVKQGDTK